MKYLLDTHIFIWSQFYASKLPDKLKSLLVDVHNEIYVSPITFWEISLKYPTGKLELKKIKPETLPKYAKESGFNITQMDETLFATFYKLPNLSHKDPFDRMLIWEAINGGYTLMSNDKSFAEYKKYGLKLVI